jgi:hypothetical protein
MASPVLFWSGGVRLGDWGASRDAGVVRTWGAHFEAQGKATLRPHNGIGRRTHLRWWSGKTGMLSWEYFDGERMKVCWVGENPHPLKAEGAAPKGG